jgi:hypothetical protein
MIKIEISQAVALLLQEHGSRRIEPDDQGRYVIEVDQEVFDTIIALAREHDRTINEALVDVLSGRTQW